jgi:hypothetical protein
VWRRIYGIGLRQLLCSGRWVRCWLRLRLPIDRPRYRWKRAAMRIYLINDEMYFRQLSCEKILVSLEPNISRENPDIFRENVLDFWILESERKVDHKAESFIEDIDTPEHPRDPLGMPLCWFMESQFLTHLCRNADFPQAKTVSSHWRARISLLRREYCRSVETWGHGERELATLRNFGMRSLVGLRVWSFLGIVDNFAEWDLFRSTHQYQYWSVNQPFWSVSQQIDQ